MGVAYKKGSFVHFDWLLGLFLHCLWWDQMLWAPPRGPGRRICQMTETAHLNLKCNLRTHSNVYAAIHLTILTIYQHALKTKAGHLGRRVCVTFRVHPFLYAHVQHPPEIWPNSNTLRLLWFGRYSTLTGRKRIFKSRRFAVASKDSSLCIRCLFSNHWCEKYTLIWQWKRRSKR